MIAPRLSKASNTIITSRKGFSSSIIFYKHALGFVNSDSLLQETVALGMTELSSFSFRRSFSYGDRQIVGS